MFEERAVAFIDIMGFTELIKDVESGIVNTSLFFDLKNTIERQTNNDFKDYTRGYDYPRKYIFISDSIVITSNTDKYSVRFLLLDVKNVARSLLKLGYLVRGGVCIGNVFQDNNNIFGTGYINAYKLERICRTPRIIITRDVQQILSQQIDYDQRVSKILNPNIDFDGWAYIDAFWEFDIETASENLKLFRNPIVTNLSKHSVGSSPYSYWHWTAVKFNKKRSEMPWLTAYPLIPDAAIFESGLF